MRGLKLVITPGVSPYGLVAPPAGAWIETIFTAFTRFTFSVAPPAGAWIETNASWYPPNAH